MENISLSAELGEIRYAIGGAHWVADSVAMGAVPDPERTHSAPVIISAVLLLVENRLHQLCRVLRGEENPAHLLTSHNVTGGEYADWACPGGEGRGHQPAGHGGRPHSGDMLETGSTTQGKTGG